MLKKSLFLPAHPDASIRAYSHALFSHRSDHQRSPTREQDPLGGLGRAGEKSYQLVPRHRRLTNSAARTDVALLIRRTVRLAAALSAERRVLARRGWAGENLAFLSILLMGRANDG